MILKELKFLIRQIVREEIVDLVREKNISLAPPKTIFVDKKSQFNTMKNPFLEKTDFNEPLPEYRINKLIGEDNWNSTNNGVKTTEVTPIIETSVISKRNERPTIFKNEELNEEIKSEIEELDKKKLTEEFEKSSMKNGRDLFKI